MPLFKKTTTGLALANTDVSDDWKIGCRCFHFRRWRNGQRDIRRVSIFGTEKNVLGFLEEDCRNDGKMLNGKPIHDISHLNQFFGKNRPLLIGGIGTTKRKRLLMELGKKGYGFDTIIHPRAINSRWARIGDGSIVTAGVVVTCQADIGRHVILNLGVNVLHDVKIGDYTTLSPGSKVMGRAVLGDEVFLGANAIIIEGVKVGNGAIIGAGAVVVKDVPPMSLVAGVPAEVNKIYKSQEEKP